MRGDGGSWSRMTDSLRRRGSGTVDVMIATLTGSSSSSANFIHSHLASSFRVTLIAY